MFLFRPKMLPNFASFGLTNIHSSISFYSWWILGHPITMGMRINQNSCVLSRRNCAAHPVASVLSPAGNSRLEQSLKFKQLRSKLSFQLPNGKCVKTCSLLFPIMSNLVLEMFISKPNGPCFLPFKNIISGMREDSFYKERWNRITFWYLFPFIDTIIQNLKKCAVLQNCKHFAYICMVLSCLVFCYLKFQSEGFSEVRWLIPSSSLTKY